MQVRAIHRNARMSPQKVREVAREVQGMPVSKALALLAYTPKKAAVLIGRVLQSAIANAVNNNGLDEETLYVQLCTATDGLKMKRIMPRARGSAAPIIKRMSHITVVVAPKDGSAPAAKTDAADEAEPTTEAPAKKAAKKKAAKPAAKSARKAKTAAAE